MTVCFFDIDGTMLLTGGAGQAAMEAALAVTFPAGRPVEGIAYAGRTDRAIVNDLFRFHGTEPSDERFLEFLEVYLEHLPGNLAALTGTVLPGVAELLLELSRSEEILLGLLTGNNQQGAMLKLGHYELDGYFRCGGFGDHHEHRDDVARDAMNAATQVRGKAVDSSQVWVIGDTPADVQCARAIGAKAVAVATGSYTSDALKETNPDFLFEDFSEPAELSQLIQAK